MTPPRKPRGHDGGLVRPYVRTDGRSAPSRNHFDAVTLVSARPSTDRGRLGPDARRVVELCLPGALSVAEIGAHLDVPLVVLRIVLADLMDAGHIMTQAPPQATDAVHPRQDRELLEKVLHGLKHI